MDRKHLQQCPRQATAQLCNAAFWCIPALGLRPSLGISIPLCALSFLSWVMFPNHLGLREGLSPTSFFGQSSPAPTGWGSWSCSSALHAYWQYCCSSPGSTLRAWPGLGLP